MGKNYVENFWTNQDQINEFMNYLSELMDCFTKESKEENAEKSFVSKSGCKYKDGKLVKKYEKEYVNGKCVKDKEYTSKGTDTVVKKACIEKAEDKPTSAENTIDTKKMSFEVYKAIVGRNEELVKENDILQSDKMSLHNQINEMTHFIDELNDKIKKLEESNNRLNSIINNVKNCF